MTGLSLTGAALAGEPWRLWTGHLAHWGAEHLALNVVAMLPPLLLLRRREAARTVAWLVAAAPLISASILASGVPVYRGASGLVVALWTAAALTLWRRRDPVPALLLLAIVAAKLSLEDAGVALVAHEGYYVVAVAHQAGAALGLALGSRQGTVDRGKGSPTLSQPGRPTINDQRSTINDTTGSGAPEARSRRSRS